ncbi:MAG: hydroxypyruvate isomerase family protein [Litorivicinus sp.]
MPQFSANLGFLWSGLPLPAAIARAKAAGFAAVECHFPYAVDARVVRAALDQAELPMLGLNTVRGPVGFNGLAGVPGEVDQARLAIEQAVDYAAAVGCHNVHVMAGIADGEAAMACFVNNLSYACDLAADHGIGILVEALNPYDAPGYLVANTQVALAAINAVAKPNIRLMFDCYHVARTEGDVITRLEACWDHIGHIQFAGVPDRGVPRRGDSGAGEVDFGPIFEWIDARGWRQPLGAEYKTSGLVEDSLGWMHPSR